MTRQNSLAFVCFWLYKSGKVEVTHENSKYCIYKFDRLYSSFLLYGKRVIWMCVCRELDLSALNLNNIESKGTRSHSIILKWREPIKRCSFIKRIFLIYWISTRAPIREYRSVFGFLFCFCFAKVVGCSSKIVVQR